MTSLLITAKNLMRSSRRGTMAIILFMVAYGIFAHLHPNGFGTTTITTNSNQGAALALATVGQSIVLLAGGIDLSIGSILVLVRSVASHMLDGSTFGILLGLLACLATGTLAGWINGAIIVYGRIQPVIATLASGLVFYGFALWLRPTPGGKVSLILGDFLTYESNIWLPDFLGTTILGRIPSAIIAIILMTALVWLPLRRTLIGRALIATGSNPQAAKMSGLPVQRAKIVSYMIGGFFAACGGIFMSALTLTGDANGVQTGFYTLNTLAASVIGGTSLAGGIGGVLGPIFGAYTLSMIGPIIRASDKILWVFDASPIIQPLFEGLILLFAISLGAAAALREKNRLLLLGQAYRSREDQSIFKPLILGLLVTLVLIIAASAILLANGDTLPFLSFNFLILQIQNAAFLGAFSLGAFLVIKIGQIDLSMPGAITACAMIGTMNTPVLTIPTILLVGILIGLVNGVGVAYLRVPSIIFTLGVNSVLLGMISIITGGFAPSSQATELMTSLGSGRLISPIPNAALLILAFFFLMWFLLKRSRLGREISAIGFSEGAAYLSGIRTPLVIVGIFVAAGFCYGVGTILLTGFSGKAFQGMGNPYLMPAIAAVVLGGSNIAGGRGHPLAMLIGVMVVVLIQSTLATIQMPPALREIIHGSVLILILLGQSIQPKRKRKSMEQSMTGPGIVEKTV
ncbi:ABC transporter permease [uncultured Cohaesibacter sp.]|uniref:ABC transporter permease n=1 Tax=uncultured Cohaesibacter sp. TaxID=1002546 RepID=UPI0029C99BB0|nr:ABC transporter permease [uncultured Cohaesibacter sp.]